MIGGASVLNVIGAALNSLHLHIAFGIWIVSNIVCATYFYGASRRWWMAEKTGERTLAAMYTIFLLTAVNGYLN